MAHWANPGHLPGWFPTMPPSRRSLLWIRRNDFHALPPHVQSLWLRGHFRLHLRPPSAPAWTARSTGTPTQEQLIAHLQTSGRRFARAYWTHGLPRCSSPKEDLGGRPG